MSTPWIITCDAYQGATVTVRAEDHSGNTLIETTAMTVDGNGQATLETTRETSWSGNLFFLCDGMAESREFVAESALTAGQAAKLEMIGSATVTYSGPMAADGTWQVYAGDDSALIWTMAWTAAIPDSAAIRIALESAYHTGATVTAALTKACTLSLYDGTLTVTAALSDTETASLPTSPTNGPHALRAQVIAQTGTATQTIVDAKGKCIRKIAATA